MPKDCPCTRVSQRVLCAKSPNSKHKMVYRDEKHMNAGPNVNRVSVIIRGTPCILARNAATRILFTKAVQGPSSVKMDARVSVLLVAEALLLNKAWPLFFRDCQSEIRLIPSAHMGRCI